MLGVRRTGVTAVERTLQAAGMIQYRRGYIKLLDIDALQKPACECYQTIKLNYDALLHPSNKDVRRRFSDFRFLADIASRADDVRSWAQKDIAAT